MKRQIIDTFQNYQYLTDEYIDKILKEKTPFPPNSYKSITFLDLTTNIFEIPYITVLNASIELLTEKAPKIMSVQKLKNFITTIFHQYNFIAYHNFTHGACVMQLFLNMLEQSKKFSSLLNKEEQFIYLLTCLCHDNSHPGYNNNYLVKKKHQLSYNFYEKSVLENYHIIQMLKKLDQENQDIFEYMSKEQKKILKAQIIEGIICTDISYHFQLIEFLKKVNFIQPKEEEKNKFIGTIIHMMDIGNPILPYSSYIDQAGLVSQEFHDQTIQEKNHGLEITSFFVFKDYDGFLNSQKGFINTFVLPITKIVSQNYDLDFEEKVQINLKKIEQRLKEKELLPSHLN